MRVGGAGGRGVWAEVIWTVICSCVCWSILAVSRETYAWPHVARTSPKRLGPRLRILKDKARHKLYCFFGFCFFDLGSKVTQHPFVHTFSNHRKGPCLREGEADSTLRGGKILDKNVGLKNFGHETINEINSFPELPGCQNWAGNPWHALRVHYKKIWISCSILLAMSKADRQLIIPCESPVKGTVPRVGTNVMTSTAPSNSPVRQVFDSGYFSGSEDKESTWQYRRLGFNPWVWKIPWRREWQPTPVFLPGESQRQRSLEGYSPWRSQRSRPCLNY